jgi:hypothetical protein
MPEATTEESRQLREHDFVALLLLFGDEKRQREKTDAQYWRKSMPKT